MSPTTPVHWFRRPRHRQQSARLRAAQHWHWQRWLYAPLCSTRPPLLTCLRVTSQLPCHSPLPLPIPYQLPMSQVPHRSLLAL